jgi:hypothetical protein
MAVQQQSSLVQVLQCRVGSLFMQSSGAQWHSAHLMNTIDAREGMGSLVLKPALCHHYPSAIFTIN